MPHRDGKVEARPRLAQRPRGKVHPPLSRPAWRTRSRAGPRARARAPLGRPRRACPPRTSRAGPPKPPLPRPPAAPPCPAGWRSARSIARTRRYPTPNASIWWRIIARSGRHHHDGHHVEPQRHVPRLRIRRRNAAANLLVALAPWQPPPPRPASPSSGCSASSPPRTPPPRRRGRRCPPRPRSTSSSGATMSYPPPLQKARRRLLAAPPEFPVALALAFAAMLARGALGPRAVLRGRLHDAFHAPVHKPRARMQGGRPRLLARRPFRLPNHAATPSLFADCHDRDAV